jgi:hypothetical protein
MNDEIKKLINEALYNPTIGSPSDMTADKIIQHLENNGLVVVKQKDLDVLMKMIYTA